MRLTFGAEQDELRGTLRRYLANRLAEAEIRRLFDDEVGYDLLMWKDLARALELPGIGVPEAFGGQGFGPIETAVVFEEMGRVLAPTPYFSTVALASNLLLATADAEAQHDYLPPICAGDSIATVAFKSPDRQWNGSAMPVRASVCDGAWTLSGEALFVVDGHVADLVLVAAATEAGTSLFAVTVTDADGLSVEPMSVVDSTRRQARMRFDGVRGRAVGSPGQGWAAVRTMLDGARLALALEQVGGARRCLEMTLDYVKTRHQFGQPIGGFQAIKHRCAEMAFQVEKAVSATYLATWMAAEGDPDASLAISSATACASAMFKGVAAETIQLHGGIGFTWEHAAHLYYRRAHSSAVLLGDAAVHVEDIARACNL